jgi:predicted flap endonuclease-1-like 5' DNA nuclease
MGKTIGVEVPLADLDVRLLDRLLQQAWEAAAPKRLVAQRGPATAAARTMGLPAIGRPAAAALGLAGITTLDEVARHTEEELLALHGVGPKAVRILREALAAGGQGLRAR